MNDLSLAKPPEDAFAEHLELLTAGITEKDASKVQELLQSVTQEEVGWLVDRLEPETQKSLLTLIGPEAGAELLEHVFFLQGTNLIENLEPKEAASIVALLHSDDRVDYLKELKDEDSSAILEHLDEDVAESTRELMAYPEGTAGSFMYSEFLAFRGDMTVSEILSDLRSNRDAYNEYGIQYAYILDSENRLLGVLPARNLLFAKPEQQASRIMIPDPVTLSPETTLIDLDGLFNKYSFLGLPVVDSNRRLLGIVDREAPREALQEAATEDLLKVQGLMGKEELRSMPLMVRSKRRLSWLSINIVLNLISASVIAVFQGTLEAVIALAVFLPIISDMSGCSGNQAVAVSMRELTLGLVSPKEFKRVFIKESLVGLLNGSALGLLIGTIAFIWKGNAYLGLVVGGAMACNTIIAVCVGGLVPLLLKAFKQDPALASGPILTTVTDMCGFLLILGIATLFLPYLV